MLATIIWLIICTRGLWVWRHNARQAEKNRQSVLDDKLASMFVRSEGMQDDLRAIAFSFYILLGIGALFLQEKTFVLHHLTLVRYYGDFLQAVLVFGVFIFALNGEIARVVQQRVLGSVKPPEPSPEEIIEPPGGTS